jgi:hypothetical protein
MTRLSTPTVTASNGHADFIERRLKPRRSTVADEPIRTMRLRAGRDVQAIDVSDGGALVEGASRLLPGTHVDVHVIARHGRILVRSRVVRAKVTAISLSEVVYRCALAFDHLVDTGYSVPAATAGQAAVLGTRYPVAVAEVDSGVPERLSA